MSDAHAVARDQLRAFIERIERLEEEKKTIADDIKDVYGEAKGTGFDTKVLRKLISIRKQDRDERAEQEAILDMYMIALGMVDEPAGYDEPRQSAPVERQPAMALRSDGGLSIVTKHEDIRTSDGSPSVSSSLTTREPEESVVSNSPVTANETHERPSTNDEPSPEVGPQAEASPAGTGTGMLADREGRHDGEAASADLPTHSDQPLTGGDHVDGGALRANRDENGEGAASTLPSKPKHRLRPNCLDRSNCKSGSVDHCWSCKKAVTEKSEVAA